MFSKSDIQKIIEEKRDIFIGVSDKIWECAEISLDEHQSSETLISLLENEGFIIERGLCGIETAFSATFGNGKPVIGILGEYDALDGLDQMAYSAVKERSGSGKTSGHGCGHNLLGAGSAAAAVAVKEYLKTHTGTVIYFGCPGEEGWASKTVMAKEGLFSSLDCAFCWHPDSFNRVSVGSCQASIQVEYSFTGIAAHAAENPENGRSALDALTLMNVGVQFLREHIPAGDCLHYAVIDTGGVSPNVVQASAKVMYMVRSNNVRNAKKLLARVNKIAEGAAMMTETEVSHKLIDGTSNTLSNGVLEKVLFDNFKSVSLPEYTDDEKAFADKLFATYKDSTANPEMDELTADDIKFVLDSTDNFSVPLNGFLYPYKRTNKVYSGSTDVGDVSWNVPTAQIGATTWTSKSPGHSWQNVSIGKSEIAHKGMLTAGKIMAMSAYDLYENPELIAKAKEEFQVSAAGGYDCPINE